MDGFTRLVENTRDIKKQNCFKELGELVNNLRSTSRNGIIFSDRNMRKRNRPCTESLTTVLRRDGTVDGCVTDDVSFKIECLLDLWKLKETRTDVNQTDQDSEDEELVPLSEIAEICARHFVSFGIQLVAASCAGHVFWMKALLRVGANPNEMIVSDTRHKTLTAFHGCLEYAPEETRVEGLKLLLANRCKETKADAQKRYTSSQLFENGFTGMLQWLKISDFGKEFETDLQKAARHCDHQRMEVSTINIIRPIFAKTQCF